MWLLPVFGEKASLETVDLGFSSGKGCKQGKAKRVRANVCCTQLRKGALRSAGYLFFRRNMFLNPVIRTVIT